MLQGLEGLRDRGSDSPSLVGSRKMKSVQPAKDRHEFLLRLLVWGKQQPPLDIGVQRPRQARDVRLELALNGSVEGTHHLVGPLLRAPVQLMCGRRTSSPASPRQLSTC